MIDKYYQEELLYLRELGAEFARAHPTSAYLLAAPGSDPDVERLLEGFAFLSARIRAKLEDELPEVTHGLMALLCPHYLRPVPSMTILEFQPVLAALRQTRTVPRGVEVRSVPVEGTSCRFRTAYQVELNPLSLEEVRLESGAGPSRLLLQFRIWNQARPETLDLRRLRFYMHGDPSVSFALYHHLRNHVREVVLWNGAPGAAPGTPSEASAGAQPGVQPVGGLRFAEVGFADDEAVIEYPARSFPGYRLLQEYLAFPAKFLFLDLLGLEGLREFGAPDRFTVEVRFDRALPAGLAPGKDEIRLFCTPVVNLFPHEADPIRVDRTRSEYRVRPAGTEPLHYEIHSIDRVSVTRTGSGEDRDIPDFYSFEHGAGAERLVYYAARSRASVVDGRSDTYLAFVDARGGGRAPEAETASILLTCTNRRLPEALRVGDIQIPSESTPEFVRFRNLLPATVSIPPPLEGDLHWRLLSHLALNYLSLADAETLRGILGLYNFQTLHDARAAVANTRRLAGIREVRSHPGTLVLRDGVVRGTEVAVELQEDHFAGAGDLYLFATLLNEFFALHATLNSYTRLTVHGVQRGEVYRWPARTGKRILV
jgi:type VI secretion system protein ImpG